jgi:hypothetical protein
VEGVVFCRWLAGTLVSNEHMAGAGLTVPRRGAGAPSRVEVVFRAGTSRKTFMAGLEKPGGVISQRDVPEPVVWASCGQHFMHQFPVHSIAG